MEEVNSARNSGKKWCLYVKSERGPLRQRFDCTRKRANRQLSSDEAFFQALDLDRVTVNWSFAQNEVISSLGRQLCMQVSRVESVWPRHQLGGRKAKRSLYDSYPRQSGQENEKAVDVLLLKCPTEL